MFVGRQISMIVLVHWEPCFNWSTFGARVRALSEKSFEPCQETKCKKWWHCAYMTRTEVVWSINMYRFASSHPSMSWFAFRSVFIAVRAWEFVSEKKIVLNFCEEELDRGWGRGLGSPKKEVFSANEFICKNCGDSRKSMPKLTEKGSWKIHKHRYICKNG